MTGVLRWSTSRPLDVDVTLGGPLPSDVGDLDSILSRNASLLTDDELQRLILESPYLLRPASSNFDTATQVDRHCSRTGFSRVALCQASVSGL